MSRRRAVVSWLALGLAASAILAFESAAAQGRSRPVTTTGLPAGGARDDASLHWVSAFAAFGEPKYAGVDHLPYADPAAPKGGTLLLANPDTRTGFDKFNDFTLRGDSPAGIITFMLEPLAERGADEPMTMYGLLAESIAVEPDRSAISFRLNPAARFSNGDAVTAEDVAYSFASVTGPRAAPAYVSKFAGVRRAVVLDPRTIRFELADKSIDTLFKLGGLLVFSHKWGLLPDGSHKPFDEIVGEPPIASGPYTVASFTMGRRIDFKRNPAYWGRDLPMRRGFYNFDRVVYRYYTDEDIGTEAFKAGEFDLVRVYGADLWARRHRGPKWDDGRIIALTLPVGTGQGLQSYEFNLRRRLFQDIRVREALTLSYDLETNDRYHRLRHPDSIFNNSEFAARGLPSPGELALLEPFRATLPPAVFGPAFVAPRTGGDAGALRRNLLKARALLESAGWRIAADGVLRNAAGEPFEFEYLASADQDTDRHTNPWRHNLAKLGIVVHDRKVDPALYMRRVEGYDFDMMLNVSNPFTLPSAADMQAEYGSKAAVENGNLNYRGVQSPAVDRVIAAMSEATSMTTFRDACRALDRIVMWSYWQVPELYRDDIDISFWNKFGMPAVRPRYFTIDLPTDVDPLLAWPLATWWIKNPAGR